MERYRRLVWSVIVKHRMRPEEAEDIFQHVFTALITHIDSINDENALASWIVTTTKRRCWRVSGQARQAAERSRSLDAGEDNKLDPTDQREDPIETRAHLERQLVREGLERLGGKCKDLLEALFGAGGEPNYTLIAEKLGIRIGSIGPTRARCLEKLSKVLGCLGFGDAAPEDAGSGDGDAGDNEDS